MSIGSIEERWSAWAIAETAVYAFVQIGSRVRKFADLASSDSNSDWDYQIITDAPDVFESSLRGMSSILGAPLAWAPRIGRLGSARKISAVYPDGELDIVLIPLGQFRVVHQHLLKPSQTLPRDIKLAMDDLSLVVKGGYRIIKGGDDISTVYEHLGRNIASPRLSDERILNLAEEFVCDYVSIRRKLARGELLAAQRWLHLHMGEVNFMLWHELRQRTHLPSFPDARRVELVADDNSRLALTISALPTHESIEEALERSARTFRYLMKALISNRWNWPDLPSSLSRK